jgi:hypothetical protein
VSIFRSQAKEARIEVDVETMNETPLSELIASHKADGTAQSFDRFLDAFCKSRMGVYASGASDDLREHFVSTTEQPISVARTRDRHLLAFADPAAFAQTFGPRFNASLSGVALLATVLHSADCQGIRVNSALDEISIIIDRGVVARLALLGGGMRWVHNPRLHLVTRDSPTVRLGPKTNRQIVMPRICCNCLGPFAKCRPINASRGLLGFFDLRTVRLPLCTRCLARTRRGSLGLCSWVVAAGLLFFWVFTALVVPRSEMLSVMVAAGILFCPIALIALAVGWREICRTALAKLVQVVDLDSNEGWMDVRFGNQDYARLAAELRCLEPDET